MYDNLIFERNGKANMYEKGLKQFAIYSRKSKFTGKGESVENQVEMCRQYISTHYGKEVADSAKVYEDEGFSGGTLDRPQFKKMMQDSYKDHIDALVVYRLDRISRNIGDFAGLITDLSYRNIEFISIREQFDTSSPIGRAMMYIASVFSQLERETIAERIRDNMHELAKTGRWLGGVTPTGYESESVVNVNIDGKSKKAYKLKIIPEEKELVTLIFDKFIETGSLTKTDEFLLSNHFVTKNGIPFSRFAIKGILSNPVYMKADEDAYKYLVDNNISLFCEKLEFDGIHGVMVYNRTLQKKGKTHQIKPMDEWIASIGKHQGIISGAKWVQVQNLLEMNRSKSYRKPRSNVALLSGLLKCADCGSYMRPKLSNRKNAAGELIYTYVCNTKERSKSEACHIRNVNGNTLDAMVVDVIKQLGEDSGELIHQLEIAKKHILADSSVYGDTITRIKANIISEENEISTLTLALARAEGRVAEQYVLDQIEKIHNHIEELKSQLKTLESASAQHNLSLVEFDIIKQMLSGFGQSIDLYSIEEKRALIKTFVRKIAWDGNMIHIFMFNSDEDCEFPLPIHNDISIATNEPSGEYSE